MSKHFPSSQSKKQLTSHGKKQAKEERNGGIEFWGDESEGRVDSNSRTLGKIPRDILESITKAKISPQEIPGNYLSNLITPITCS